MKKGIKSLLLASVAASSLLTTGCNLLSNEQLGWHTGDKLPDNNEGKDGDFYFNTETNEVYYKTNGGWVKKTFSQTKDIDKIEKVSSGGETDTYKITYVDGTTDTFELNKNAEIIPTAQEELLEKFNEISEESMAENYFYYSMEATGVESGVEMSRKTRQTTDENGSYAYEELKNGTTTNTGYYYHIKSDDKYIQYGIIDNNKSAFYTDQEWWERQTTNKIKFLDDGGILLFNFKNVFSSATLADLKNNIKQNLTNDTSNDSAKLPVEPIIEFKEEYDTTINQLKLILDIDVSYKTIEDHDITLHISIVSYDGRIKQINVDTTQTYNNQTNTTNAVVNMEYYTNSGLVVDLFDSFPEPTE